MLLQKSLNHLFKLIYTGDFWTIEKIDVIT